MSSCQLTRRKLKTIDFLGNDTRNQNPGKIIQRFPEKDWDDTPFIEGIELVTQ